MATYANVIIDISHEKRERTFQYRIPENLRESVSPGVPVDVPFGNGDRITQTVYVEDLRENLKNGNRSILILHLP